MPKQRINLFTNGFHLPVGRAILERAFADTPLGRMIYLSSAEDVPNLKTEQPILQHSGSLDDVDWEQIRPLDEDIIEALRPCEAVFMEMINRIEDRGRIISYAERKRTYLRIVRYWNHMLEQHEISLFLSTGLPHRIRTHVLAALCVHKRIPVLFFHHTSPIPAQFYLARDWEESAIGLQQRVQELLTENPAEVELPEAFETYYQKQTGQAGDPTPWFVRKKKATPHRDWFAMVFSELKSNFRTFLQKARVFIAQRCTRQFWARWFTHRRQRRNANALFSFYDANASAPDLSKKFIYLPLQMQPEATTCPMAGAYVQQLLMAQMLSSLVLDDILIYVKEHPNQQRNYPDGRYRSLAFYKELMALPNVRIVPRRFDTYALMENAIAIATATGSAGFEGLFRSKPFLMFGHDYYQYAPGVFRIHSSDDCRQALSTILSGGAAPTHHQMRLFLRALSDVTVPGYVSTDMKAVSSITDEQCAENLGALLEKRVREALAQPVTASPPVPAHV